MNPQTIGRENNPGKVAQIQCVRGTPPDDLDLSGKCFLLLLVYAGEARFSVGGRTVEAHAPAMVCFDERENPTLLSQSGLVCDSIYFHPSFFNVNLTFERVRSEDFREAAPAHDLYLMRPFTDAEHFVFPLFDEYIATAKRLFENLSDELDRQRDHYWSCRSRTYFIRLIFLLESVYGLMGESTDESRVAGVHDPLLRAAVIFIEGHYSDLLTRADIAAAASTNEDTVNRLFKSELGMTALDYLWHHRITVAKRQLRFTKLPVTEIAAQCGFKTLPHFSRKFEAMVGMTPTAFREQTVARRMQAFEGP